MTGSRQKRKDGRPARARTGSEGQRAERPPSVAFPVVAAGASAGGVEAFSELLQHLSPDTGMAFVLIQHLAPKQKTMLPEILARCTTMPVLEAEDEMEVQPDHIYVMPPGEDMTIFHGRLNLVERSAAGLHLPIDHFLRSLALDQGPRAIGVVLSGTASDGSLGLAAVKAEGGITFAQEPSSARYGGMPSSAINANAVDMVLDPAGIAAELARLGKHPYLVGDDTGTLAVRPQAEAEQADLMTRIYVVLRSAFGVDFSTYRKSTILRRIDRRIVLHKMTSLEEYVDYLGTHPAEVEELYHDILIMVTEFFREPAAFEALSGLLPRIIEEKGDEEQLRVWVPGCATGEEPYSIALALVKALKGGRHELPVKIFGTDINERDLGRARSGVYEESKVQAIPEEYRRYFTPTEGGYQVNKLIRDMVVFARHDVTADPPFSQLDLVSCRNLLIYLAPATQERVIPVFHYALRPHGYLMLGSSESIGAAADLFAPLDKANMIFVRKDVPHRMSVRYASPDAAGGPRRKHSGTEFVTERRFEPRREADEILLARFTPPSVVVDDDYEIMQFRGVTDDYLKHGAGRASLNLLEMAREGLGPEIRAVIDDARMSGLPGARQKTRYRIDGELRDVDLEAVPIAGPAGERYFLLVFHALGRGGPAEAQLEGGAEQPQDRGEIADLHRELDLMRDHMKSIMQDKEAALEGLRAANEEIQSSNEELQSINEELETAKEELQSTNEELRTVNEELEDRNLQLSRANDDLSNLLRAVSVPTIMVGRDLRIRRFTPGTERVMNLIAADVGRPITDIALRLDLPDLGEMLTNVIENITVEERELRDEQGHWYAMRIRPYQTEENRIEGAVLTLVDVHELRTTLATLSQATRLSDGVNRMLTALQDEREVSSVIRLILQEAATAVQADAALVLHRRQGSWVVAHAHGAPERLQGSVMSDEQLPQASMAEMSRGPVVVRASAGLRPFPGDVDARSMVAAPLLAGDQVLGALLFMWKDQVEQPDEAGVDYASKVAALVALAIAAAGR